MKRKISILLGVICGLQLLSPAAMAESKKITEIYVSADGSDANDGSIDAPFETLEKASQKHK